MGGNKEMREKLMEKTVAILQWLKAKHILLELCKDKTKTCLRVFHSLLMLLLLFDSSFLSCTHSPL